MRGSGGDHHGGGVDAVLAAQPFESQGHVHDLAHLVLLGVHGAQLDGLVVAGGVRPVALQAGFQRRRAPHDRLGDGLRDPVADRIGMVQHPRRVAYGGPSLDGGEGDDLRHLVAPVAVGRVADQVVPVTGVEVHVDVGHLPAAGVQESLEQQVVAQRIETGDTQAVRDGTTGRRCPVPDPP